MYAAQPKRDRAGGNNGKAKKKDRYSHSVVS